MSSDNTYSPGTSAEFGREVRPDGLEAEVRHDIVTRLDFAMPLIRRGVEATLGHVPDEEVAATQNGEINLRATEAEADVERVVPITTRDQAVLGGSTQITAVDYGQGAAPAIDDPQEKMLAAARAAYTQIYDAEDSGKLPPRIDRDLAEAINFPKIDFPKTGSTVVELRSETPSSTAQTTPAQIVPFAPLPPAASNNDQQIAA